MPQTTFFNNMTEAFDDLHDYMNHFQKELENHLKKPEQVDGTLHYPSGQRLPWPFSFKKNRLTTETFHYDIHSGEISIPDPVDVIEGKVCPVFLIETLEMVYHCTPDILVLGWGDVYNNHWIPYRSWVEYNPKTYEDIDEWKQNVLSITREVTSEEHYNGLIVDFSPLEYDFVSRDFDENY